MDREECEARMPVLSGGTPYPPPSGSDSEGDVGNIWNKSVPSKIFFTFIWEGYTKQRLRKHLYLLDNLSCDDAHMLIQRVLNYSKRLGTCKVRQMAL